MSKRDLNSVHPSTRSSDGLVHWLIHHAALRAPASLAERLEEEWQADLMERHSALSRLRFAFGCCWATRVIAQELGASSIAAASSATGDKLIVSYLHNDSGIFSRRSSTFLLVAGVHIALLYGLITNLAPSIIKVITPLQNQVLERPHPRELPPLLLPSPVITTKIPVPIPEAPTWRDVDDREDIVPQPPSTPPQVPPSTPTHVMSRVQGGPGSGFPNTDDYYPSAAKRMEEQGIATVRVCVDANGRLTADPVTAQTSGSSRLDQGALQLAKAGSGHYRATTEDGRPVNSCYAFRIRFELKN